eukprot:7776801-Pyramimonas_sp.AAC.1
MMVPSWGHIGASWGLMGACWGHLGGELSTTRGRVAWQCKQCSIEFPQSHYPPTAQPGSGHLR